MVASAALAALAAVEAAPAVGRTGSRGLAVPSDARQLIVVSSPTDRPPPPGYLATLRTYTRASLKSPWRPVFGASQAETGSGHLLPRAPAARVITPRRSGYSASGARCTATTRIR